MAETNAANLGGWRRTIDVAVDPFGLVRNEVNSFCIAIRNALASGAELSSELFNRLIDDYLPYSSKLSNLSDAANETKNQGYTEFSSDISLVGQLLAKGEAESLEHIVAEINHQLRICQMLETKSAKIDWRRFDQDFFSRMLSTNKGTKDRGVYLQDIIGVLLPWASLLSWHKLKGADSFGMTTFVGYMTWSWDRKNKDRALTDEEKAGLFDPTQPVETKLQFMKARLTALENPSREVADYLEGINAMLDLIVEEAYN